MPRPQTDSQFAPAALRLVHALDPDASCVEIVSCHVLAISAHPRLPDRRVALVSVHLTETFGGFKAEHNLQLRLHVIATPDVTIELLHRLVLETAARVLARLKKDMQAGPATV